MLFYLSKYNMILYILRGGQNYAERGGNWGNRCVVIPVLGLQDFAVIPLQAACI
jgi:hypothetical protein